MKNDNTKKRVTELLKDYHSGLPVWIRAPKIGTEYWAGLSRAKLYQLTELGHIRSVSIREPGQVKGVRLFHLESILSFLERCEKEAAKNSATAVTPTEVTSTTTAA